MVDASIPGTGSQERSDRIADLKSTFSRLVAGDDFDPSPIIRLFRFAGFLATIVGLFSCYLVFRFNFAFHNAGFGIGLISVGVTAVVASFFLRRKEEQ